MKTLGGIICLKDADHLDYNWRHSLKSLLDVCDMVTLCVASQNDDATEHHARWFQAVEPKIKVCIYPWPDPKGVSEFWVDWLNYARQHTPTDMVFQLDADEVLSEKSYDTVRELKQREGRFSVWCQRHNFWRDAQHLIPDGVCLARRVIRMLPQNIFLPSDGADPRGAEATTLAIEPPETVHIMHYGFLRKREAFFRKAKALQGFFFNDYDPRLDAADKAGGNWMEHPGVVPWQNELDEFKGEHPEIIKPWLIERGYKV